MTTQPASDLRPTLRFDSFFEARDEFDAAIRGVHKGELTGVEIAVFRVLLEHTVFKKLANDYGSVTKNAIGIKNLMNLTGFGRTAIVNALAKLVDVELIETERRPNINGGSRDALIHIVWLREIENDTPESVDPKCRVAASPEVSPDGTYEVSPDGISSSIGKEPLEEPATTGIISGREETNPLDDVEATRLCAEREHEVQVEIEALMPDFIRIFWDGDEAGARQAVAGYHDDPERQLGFLKDKVVYPRLRKIVTLVKATLGLRARAPESVLTDVEEGIFAGWDDDKIIAEAVAHARSEHALAN